MSAEEENRVTIHVEYREIGDGVQLVDVELVGSVATAASAARVLDRLLS